MSKRDIHVAIVGLTRRSASLGKAIREASQSPRSRLNFIVRAFDEERSHEKKAKEIGAVDEIDSMSAIVRQANIVIVDQEPHNLEFAYSILGPELQFGTVVLDLSSLQQRVQALAAQYFPKRDNGRPAAYLIGIDPMVTHAYLYDTRPDIELASADMFAKSEMIIAPSVTAPEEAVKLASDLAEIVGMTPRFMEPAEYDGLIDFTENIPLLLSAALFATLEQSNARADLERSINSTFAHVTLPLRDMQGPALIERWKHSRRLTVHHLDALLENLYQMRRVLSSDDEQAIADMAAELVMAYGMWEDRRKRGDWEGSIPKRPEIKGAGFFKNLLGFNKVEEGLDKAQELQRRKNKKS